MATGSIKNTDSIYPKYDGSYISLDDIAQGSTFTVNRSGFYTLFVSASASNQVMQFAIRASGVDVVRTFSTNGVSQSVLLYLAKNTTYTVQTKINVNHSYLYY